MLSSRLPTAAEVSTCPDCGLRVLVFVFCRGGEDEADHSLRIYWDPDALQRRWARSLMSARDHATGPRWNWTFGGMHECPPRDDSPAWDAEALRRAAEGWIMEGGG